MVVGEALEVGSVHAPEYCDREGVEPEPYFYSNLVGNNALQMLKALTFEVTLEAEDVPKPINLPVARPRLLWQRAELEYGSSIDMH